MPTVQQKLSGRQHRGIAVAFKLATQAPSVAVHLGKCGPLLGISLPACENEVIPIVGNMTYTDQLTEGRGEGRGTYNLGLTDLESSPLDGSPHAHLLVWQPAPGFPGQGRGGHHECISPTG